MLVCCCTLNQNTGSCSKIVHLQAFLVNYKCRWNHRSCFAYCKQTKPRPMSRKNSSSYNFYDPRMIKWRLFFATHWPPLSLPAAKNKECTRCWGAVRSEKFRSGISLNWQSKINCISYKNLVPIINFSFKHFEQSLACLEYSARVKYKALNVTAYLLWLKWKK